MNLEQDWQLHDLGGPPSLSTDLHINRVLQDTSQAKVEKLLKDQIPKLPADASSILSNVTNQLNMYKTNYDLDEFAVEVGIYFVLLSVCMFTMLHQVSGDPSQLKKYFLFRKLEIFPYASRNTNRVANMLLISGLYYCFAPFLVLLGWFILIYFDRIQEGATSISAWSILIIGIAFIIFGFNLMIIFWNRYHFTMKNVALTGLTILLLTTYQCVIIFGYDDNEKFLPYSAIFLVFNVLFMTLVLFLDNFEDFEDVKDLIKKYFGNGSQLNRKREDNMADEIEKQAKSEDWKPTFNDFVDIITIYDVNQSEYESLLGRSFVHEMLKKNPGQLKILKATSLIIALLVLLGYAVTLYLMDNNSKMGIVISISIVCMDLFNLTLYISKMVENASSIIVLLIINRILMVILGEKFWVYGFMILYMMYAIALLYMAAKNTFPLINQVVLSKKVDLKNAKTGQQKALAYVKGVNPFYLIIILTLLYLIFIIIIQYADFKGKEQLRPFILMAGTAQQKLLEPIFACLFSILLVVTIYLIIALIRLAIRKVTNCDKNGAEPTKSILQNKFVDLLTIYILLTFIGVVIWGFIAYWITESKFYPIWGTCGAGCVLSYFRAFIFFAMNDFEYFQNIEKLNAYIDKHNKKVDENSKKRAKIQKDLADGTLLLPPPEPSKPKPPAPDSTPDTNTKSDNQNDNESRPSSALNLNDPAPEKQPVTEGPSEAELQAQREQAQAEQQRKVQEMIKKQKEEQKQREEEQKRKLAEDSALRQQQEEERRAMEEQMRLEKEREAERQMKIQEENKRKQKEIAERQKREQAERMQAEKDRAANGDRVDKYHYSGSAQSAEMINRNKAYKEDDIYEGGDEESQANMTQTPLADQPSSSGQTTSGEILMSIDDEDKIPNFYQKIAHRKLKRVIDWRIRHKNSCCSALRARELRPNDMNFLASVIVGSIFWIILGSVLLGLAQGILGAITVWPVLYIFICLLVGSAAIYQSRSFNTMEYLIWIGINLVYLTIGLIFFIVNYEVSEFTYELEKRTELQKDAAKFVLSYVFFVPTFGNGIVCALRMADRGMKGFWTQYKFFLISFILGILCMIACCFLFVHWIDGLIFVAAVVFLCYIAFQLWIYVTNDYYVKPIWALINKTLILIAIIFAFIWSAFDDQLSSFEGGSYSAAVLLFFIWMYAISNYFLDFSMREQRPLYFSATLFPVYQYNQKLGDVELHSEPTIVFLLGLILMFFWALVSNTQLHPQFWGPIFTIAIELLILIYYMYIRQIQINGIKNCFEFMTDQIAKSSWIQVKKQYVQAKSAFTRNDLRTYRRLSKRAFLVQNYIDLQNGNKVGIKENIKKELSDEIYPPAGSEHRVFYKDQISKFIDTEKYSIDSPADMTTLLFEMQDQRMDCFMDEKSVYVSFILIAQMNAQLNRRQQRKDFLRFINEKSEIFDALDIKINIPPGASINQSYKLVQQQIEILDADKKGIFESIYQLYQNNESDAKKSRDAVREDDERQQRERDENAQRLADERERELCELQDKIDNEDKMDLDQDPNSLPDSRYKYQLIVKRAEIGSYPKFEDTKFKANNESIGDVVLSRTSELTWNRLSDEGSSYKLYIDGIDNMDIAQGECGDCYLLSAFTCMGNEYTRDKFVFLNNEEEWKKTGAFCIKFYEGGKEQIIVIDDQIPVREGYFVFARSTNKNEVWPQVLEKAYAKKYGSYSTIEGGLVSSALAELINGVPEVILTEDEQNLEKLWQNLLKWEKEGAKLGAGSNSHSDGDRAKSSLGIVQKHAFSILRLADADGHKLMCIRNPWGRGEWKGDWSDDSEKWTTRMRNLVDWHESKDDGIFWMELSDFMPEFDSIYVCKDYSDPKKWHNIEVNDKWEGEYAEGLPNSNNKGAKMEKNPQYGLTINKPGVGVIVLRLKDKQNRNQAKQYGYVNMQAIDGKLITNPNKSKQLGVIGPRNSVVQSVEVDFSSKYSYPCLFTFIVANMNRGAEGEGEYTVNIYTKDFDAKVDMINKGLRGEWNKDEQAKIDKKKKQEGMIKQLATKVDFDKALESNKLVVVDFTASWCPPCKQIAPKFAEHSKVVKGYAVLVKVDVDENEETSQACGISCMPTFQFYKNKQKVGELQGAQFDRLKEKIEELK